MKPEIWGRHLWFSLHFISLDFPEEPSTEDVRHFKSFYENLHQVIPCYKCSVNYIKHLNERPLELSDLKNNKTLFKWTVDIHNIVNKELNKSPMSFEDAWAFYNNPANFKPTINSPSHKTMNYAYLCLGILIMCIILFIVLFGRKRLK